MRISTENTESLDRIRQLLSERVQQGTSGSERTPAATPGTEAPTEDTTQFSVQMRLVTVLHQIAVQAEEVSVERVRSIAEQLRNGNYGPDAKAVAQAILSELGG